MDLTGTDHPPRDPERFLPRGGVEEAIAEDLAAAGVAVVQGPAGSGTSWVAMAAARRWEGPVTWIRPGLWVHLADFTRPLWSGAAPDAVQQGTPEQLVQAVLEVVRSEGRLLVLDDFDDLLQPPPVRGRTRDPEVALLLAALDAGELRGSGGAVLLATRRTPPGLAVPSRPIPALTREDAALLGARVDIPDPWLRRPAAIALARHLPEDAEIIDEDDPWGDIVHAIATRYLAPSGHEALLGAAAARQPAPAEALAEAVGLEVPALARAMVHLLNLDLVVHRADGWRCSRHVAAGAREVLPELLPGVQPPMLALRLGGWYIRTGQGFGEGWTSADPARMSRLGLRYSADGRSPEMALPFALHGGTAPLLERFGAWRMLRDDLGLALATGTAGLSPHELATAWVARARAAERVSDFRTCEESLTEALPLAEQAADARLLGDVHARLGRRHLMSGEPDRAGTHLRSALAVSTDSLSRCDLHNQLGALALQTGDLDAAEAAFEASLRLARETGDVRRIGSRTAGLGGVLMYRGSLRAAKELLGEAVSLGRDAGDQGGVAHRLINLALVDLLRGDMRAASRTITGLAAMGGGPTARTRCRFLSMRASLHRLAGDLDRAGQDLAEASKLAAAAGDRDLVADLAGSAGHVARIAGRYGDAMSAFDRMLAATAAGADDALRASREVDRWNAAAWAAAEHGSVGPLLEAGRRLAACKDRIPQRPFLPRWLSASLQAAEGQLLGAMAAGTTPAGLLRQLERILQLAQDDPERADNGEPAARACYAWALRACGMPGKAAEEAGRAAFQASLLSLATIEGRCAVLRGEEPPAWHGQARTLARLLE